MTNDKLKVLAFADIHGDRMLLEKHVKTANDENVDLVVIAGDVSSRDSPDSAPDNLIGPFLKIGKQVVLVHGNWETENLVQMLSDVYKVKNLNGNSFMCKGVGVFGAGGASIGPIPTSEKDIDYKLKKGLKYVKDAKRKLMVTHCHPADSMISQFTQIFAGSASIKKTIDEVQPDIVVCGHVHEAEGVEEIIGKTRVINVSRSGKVFEV